MPWTISGSTWLRRGSVTSGKVAFTRSVAGWRSPNSRRLPRRHLADAGPAFRRWTMKAWWTRPQLDLGLPARRSRRRNRLCRCLDCATANPRGLPWPPLSTVSLTNARCRNRRRRQLCDCRAAWLHPAGLSAALGALITSGQHAGGRWFGFGRPYLRRASEKHQIMWKAHHCRRPWAAPKTGSFRFFRRSRNSPVAGISSLRPI